MSVEKRMFYGAEVDASLRAKSTADFIIIGGGQAGPATAAALEELEPGVSTVLVDGNSGIAQGASLASAECVRSGWTPRAIAHQMRYSLERLFHADSFFRPGAKKELALKKQGYLYLGEEKHAEAHRATTSLMRSWGLNGIEYLGADELHKRHPWIPKHFVSARADHEAGWLDSNALARLLAEKTTNTRFFWDTPTTDIVVSGGRVGVNTSRGFISGGRIIIAAGAGSRGLANTAGLDLPILCLPRQSVSSASCHAEIPESAPFVIAPDSNAYFRRHGNGLFLGWAVGRPRDRYGNKLEPLVEPIFPISEVTDPGFPSSLFRLLGMQFRDKPGEGFRSSQYRYGISTSAGYYVSRYTDGKHGSFLSERAVIGPTESEDVIANTGHKGHGVMSSIGAAHIAASHALGRTPSIPMYQHFLPNAAFVDDELGSGL